MVTHGLFNYMESEKETLSKVSDATLQEPVTIEVDVNPQNLIERKMQKWGILKKKRVFIVKPICLGSLIRISRLLLVIDFSVKDAKTDLETGGHNYLEMNYQAISNHAERMAEIVAIAIQNSRQKVSASLVRFILHNFTTDEMKKVLLIVIQQMDLTSFMSSIVSVKGMNVLATLKVADAVNVN